MATGVATMVAESFFERAEAKCQSLIMLGFLASTNYRGDICIPLRGRKPATDTAIAGNTASATAETGHSVTSDLYIRWRNVLLALFAFFLIAKLCLLLPGSRKR